MSPKKRTAKRHHAQKEKATFRSSPVNPSQPETIFRRIFRIARDLVWAVLFFALVVFAKEHWLDHSIVGEHIRRATYDISQVWLAASRDEEPMPVVVVDIGELEPCEKQLSDGTLLSPRDVLKNVVAAVMNEQPAAVAIDVDFSPGTDIRCTPPALPTALQQGEDLGQVQWPDRGGPPFFDFCLDQKYPIFLGIYRTQYEPSKLWLGAEDYRDMAATLMLPPEGSGEHLASHQDYGIRRYMTKQILNEKAPPLPSLSYALAKLKPQHRSRIQRFLESIGDAVLPLTVIDHPSAELKVEKFLVDFSGLERLENATVNYRDGRLDLKEETLKDKFVILGYTDTAQAVDKFVVPGEVRQVAGVYWHAAAVDTLLRGVLARPTKKGELLLDGLFYLPIVFFIAGLRLAYSRKPEVHVAVHRIESVGTKIAALLVFLLGTYLVSTTRLMWDGFLLVVVVTALHPTLERYLKSAARWIWKMLRTSLPRVLFQRRRTS